MLPYQIYQALSDARTRDLNIAVRRRGALVAARNYPTNATEPSRHVRDVFARMVARVRAGNSARARSDARARSTVLRGGSTMTSTSSAGPIGCSA